MSLDFFSGKTFPVCQELGNLSAHLCMIAFWLGKEPQESSWMIFACKLKKSSLGWQDILG